MLVNIIANKDLTFSLQVSLTDKERSEFGEDANTISDELLKTVAEQLNIDSSFIKMEIQKLPERHVHPNQKDYNKYHVHEESGVRNRH